MIRLVALLFALFSQSADGGAFPVRVAARINQPRPDATVQVFLEQDHSSVAQQYLESALAQPDGSFDLTILKPGLYWLVVMEETRWSYRRGACLVDVNNLGAYKLKSVPATGVGPKWGGPIATSRCKQGIVNFTIYRSKPSKNSLH